MNRILNLVRRPDQMAVPVIQVVSPVQAAPVVSAVQAVQAVQADPSNQNQTNNAARQELYIEVLKLVEDEVMRRRMSKTEQNIDLTSVIGVQ
jgi:hypothetical protein